MSILCKLKECVDTPLVSILIDDMNGIRNASIPSVISTRYASLVSNDLDILLKGLTAQTLDSVQGAI